MVRECNAQTMKLGSINSKLDPLKSYILYTCMHYLPYFLEYKSMEYK